MNERMITLKAARINSGYKQEDVAKRIGVTVRTIQNWEAGKGAPDIIQTKELEKIYKWSADYIFFGKATR